ncbi:MAG: AMP-binding protein [Verrucomicrobia bacterium]|nr:AMP-binding protein [Verrucomicrobiota bacterium]
MDRDCSLKAVPVRMAALTFFKFLKRAPLRLNSMRWGIFLRLLGVKVGKRVVFGGRVRWKFNGDPRRICIEDEVTFTGDIDLRNRENGSIVIERGCYFDQDLRLVAARESTIRIGRKTQVGLDLVINAGANVTLSENCLISSHVHINGSGHPTFRDQPICEQGYVQEPVVIGRDVWLANSVNVLMGTTIEEGVIVGANSVISGHFPAYSIVMGNPGRVVGQRLYKDPRRNRALAPQKAAPAKSPVQRRQFSSLQAAVAEIQALLLDLKIVRETPTPTARLRRDGLIDSLNWALLAEEISRRFGPVIAESAFLSPEFDSILDIAGHLVGHDEVHKTGGGTPLRIEEEPAHLFERLRRRGSAEPDKVILRFKPEQGEFLALTYGDLLQRAQRFAAYLRANRLEAGDRLGLVLPLSEDLFVAFAGCLQAGVVPSILSYPSAKVPFEIYARNHADIFSRVGFKGIFCSKDLAVHLGPMVPPATSILSGDGWRSQSRLEEFVPVSLDETVVVQHSSGTTGIQKGVAMSHRAICHQVSQYGRALELRTDDLIVSWLPLYHDMGFIACFLMPLLVGVPVVMVSPFEWITNPKLLFELCSRYRGTLAWMPNFAFELLAERVRPSQFTEIDLTSIRALVSCSEPVSASTWERFHQAFRELGLTLDKLWSCYAMAENVFAATQAAYHRVIHIDAAFLAQEGRVKLAKAGRGIVSQGKPIAQTRIRIMDEAGRERPEGVVGEISIQSDCLLKEYCRNPEATRTAFRDGWYLTGDLGFLWEEELYVTGRKKDLIIIAGRNFYPQDIEEIVGALAEVKSGRVVAFGSENSRTGTEDLVVVAERDSDGSVLSEAVEAEVKQAVFQKLECVVNHFVLKEPGWVMKTSSGKISRNECRSKYLSEHPGAEAA